MTQGVYVVKGYVLSFTILTNEKDSEVTHTALEMIAHAGAFHI